MVESLADLHQREPEPEAWDDYNPVRWWYCVLCGQCTQEQALRVSFCGKLGDWQVSCPCCCSEVLYQWDAWPGQVLDLGEPEPGKVYRLPGFVFDS